MFSKNSLTFSRLAHASRIHLIVISLAVLVAHTEKSQASPGSLDNVWTIQTSKEQSKEYSGKQSTQPNVQADFANFALTADLNRLRAVLKSAPHISQKPLGVAGARIYLPTTEQDFIAFEAFEYSVMEESLARRYPQFKSYKVFGVDQRQYRGVIDLSIRGFHAMVRNNKTSYFIDPDMQALRLQKEAPKNYFFFKKETSPGFTCLHETFNEAHTDSFPEKYATRQNGSTLRSYRLAVTATHQYAEAVSSGAADRAETQAAIATAITRVNEVYNQDLAIELQLVANNDDLIFLDQNSEPFSNDANLDIGTITPVINNIIGSGNYDIGHLFIVGVGGVALLGSVCGEDKAEGLTGLDEGLLQSDYFYIDFVAHEIGHQFGANHTFNAISGSCGGNRNASTAWEPGSGSTIMAYAGICSPQNIENVSDDYFHAGSIEEILTFTDGGGSCYAGTASGDTPPVISAGNNYTIPAQTPFFMTASASDMDGGDIFYTWEQMDTGSSTSNETQLHEDDGNRPLFRSKLPSTEENRFFPGFEDVLDNTLSFGESYPTTTRQVKLRATARSNDFGIDFDDATVQVINTGAAFRVQDPADGSFQLENGPLRIIWETADSEFAPISCSEVDILFSNTDSKDFQSYSSLANNVANDGQHTVSLPAGTSTLGRILVKCSDNIFYSASPGTFTIVDDSNSLINISIDTETIQENALSGSLSASIVRSGNLNPVSQTGYVIEGIGEQPAGTQDFIDTQALSGTLTFDTNETDKIIEIQILDDTLFEGNEEFQVRLLNPSNALISTDTVSVTILDNELPPENTDEDSETDSPQQNKTSSSSSGSLSFPILLATVVMPTRRKYKAILLPFLGLLVLQCSPIPKESNTLHPQAKALLVYEDAQAQKDLEHALAKGEARFLGFNDKTGITIPGLTEEDYLQALDFGYQLQEGMGDVIFNKEHLELRKQFYIYASEYNRLLADKVLKD